MTLGYQKDLVSSWFERRNENAESTFDPFIYAWISLNAALSARYGRLGDRAKVKRFAEELQGHWADWLDTDAELRTAAQALAEWSPIYADPPWPDGRRDETNVSADDAKSVMLGIYAVRSNLFHGAKQFDSQRDHELVSAATQLVERILIDSGLYEMAKDPHRDLTEPLKQPDKSGPPECDGARA